MSDKPYLILKKRAENKGVPSTLPTWQSHPNTKPSHTSAT